MNISLKHTVTEMSSWANVLVGKCPVGEVPFGEVSGRKIVRPGKCLSGKSPSEIVFVKIFQTLWSMVAEFCEFSKEIVTDLSFPSLILNESFLSSEETLQDFTGYTLLILIINH